MSLPLNVFDISSVGNGVIRTLSHETNTTLLLKYFDHAQSEFEKRYNVFGYDKVNKLGKYILDTMEAYKVGFKDLDDCKNWTSTPIFNKKSESFQACPAQFRADECDDTFLDGCFKAIAEWKENGTINTFLDDIKQDLIDFINNVVAEMALSVFASGGVFIRNGELVESVALRDDLTDSLKELALLTAGKCKGYIALLRDLAEMGDTWLNVESALLQPDGKSLYYHYSPSDVQFTGNPVQVVNTLRRSAKNKLATALTNGFHKSSNRKGQSQKKRPIIICDGAMYKKIGEDFSQQSYMVTTISREVLPDGQFLYKIYDIPVFHDENLSAFSKFFKQHLGAMILTVEGNFVRGCSMGIVDANGIKENSSSVRIFRDWQNESRFFVEANTLFTSYIQDPELAVAALSLSSPQNF